MDQRGCHRHILRRNATSGRNREIVRNRLVDMIQKATVRPKRRIATKPTKSAQARRVAAKKHRGEIKKNRSSVSDGLD